MNDLQRFRNEDLVLRVSTNVDPKHWDISPYEAFIDALCGTREYQKSAIRTVLRYFLGGRYNSLRQLAEENFHSSLALQARYNTFHDMERHLQFTDQLACSVDLATGTGKSYVMYAIARIMLAHGAVDRVLVLCPSRTIEKGLTEKFRSLSGETHLKDLIPNDARIRNPRIINGTETITDGSICIENFHATLQHVKSSIRESLTQKGETTLVLNDEVHHVFNPIGKELKRWKDFLLDPAFGFKYMAGFSGTCYVDDEYFSDVVSRYSLQEAIGQGFVKTIEYVAEDTSDTQNEKLQKIYDNHIQNKTQFYRKIKPLTVLITKDIAASKRLTRDLVEFLSETEGIPSEETEKKVLIVTSSREHSANVMVLENVDSPDNPVEWITSVSMLTEGWDVKNVFQIVPSEERAFNSKLLIAQVLGRGLRIPDAYLGERPVVTVFNHAAWSSRIGHLVDEIMEVERKISSYPVSKDHNYNFTLKNINYERTQELEQISKTEEYEFSKGFVTLVSQAPVLEHETVYARAIDGQRREKKTRIRYQMFSISEVAEHIHLKLKAIDTEKGTTYSKTYNLEWLHNLIRESLKRVGESEDRVSEENRQRLQKAFGVIHRESSQVVRYRMTPAALEAINTSERKRDHIGLASLRRGDATIFWDEHSLSLSDEDTRSLLTQVLDDDSFPRSAEYSVKNSFHFKTPLNLVIADHRPERAFIRELIKPENASEIDGWIKSTDQDFYPIEFAWRKGEHSKRGRFNPDFFIVQQSHRIVVEIKGDEEIADPSDENKAKYRAAKEHFETLNSLQKDEIYHFYFLTPRDYSLFFEFLRDGNYEFVSQLDARLSEGLI